MRKTNISNLNSWIICSQPNPQAQIMDEYQRAMASVRRVMGLLDTAIACAILKDPLVLILDEATSAVDNKTEAC